MALFRVAWKFVDRRFSFWRADGGADSETFLRFMPTVEEVFANRIARDLFAKATMGFLESQSIPLVEMDVMDCVGDPRTSLITAKALESFRLE